LRSLDNPTAFFRPYRIGPPDGLAESDQIGGKIGSHKADLGAWFEIEQASFGCLPLDPSTFGWNADASAEFGRRRFQFGLSVKSRLCSCTQEPLVGGPPNPMLPRKLIAAPGIG
jgi:hypothetical protein